MAKLQFQQQKLFTGPSLKDGDSTATKDWCRHHSCIHFCKESRYIVYMYHVSIYIYLYILRQLTKQQTTLHNFSTWKFGGSGGFQTRMDLCSSPPFQLRAARESQRSGWQESPSSSSGIGFFLQCPDQHIWRNKTRKLNKNMEEHNTSWWFQPIWKILVKMGIFPR